MESYSNGINVLIGREIRKLTFFTPPCEEQQGVSYLQNTESPHKTQTIQHLNLDLPRLWNCEKISSLSKTSTSKHI